MIQRVRLVKLSVQVVPTRLPGSTHQATWRHPVAPAMPGSSNARLQEPSRQHLTVVQDVSSGVDKLSRGGRTVPCRAAPAHVTLSSRRATYFFQPYLRQSDNNARSRKDVIRPSYLHVWVPSPRRGPPPRLSFRADRPRLSPCSLIRFQITSSVSSLPPHRSVNNG